MFQRLTDVIRIASFKGTVQREFRWVRKVGVHVGDRGDRVMRRNLFPFPFPHSLAKLTGDTFV
jgi:hypothetical protein